MIYPKELPKQKDCRIDFIHRERMSIPLLIDTNDESVIFVGSASERTLTEVYKSMLYFMRVNLGVDTYLYQTGRKFKKFDNVLYKDY